MWAWAWLAEVCSPTGSCRKVVVGSPTTAFVGQPARTDQPQLIWLTLAYAGLLWLTLAYSGYSGFTLPANMLAAVTYASGFQSNRGPNRPDCRDPMTALCLSCTVVPVAHRWIIKQDLCGNQILLMHCEQSAWFVGKLRSLEMAIQFENVDTTRLCFYKICKSCSVRSAAVRVRSYSAEGAHFLRQ